ncbi:AmmeMemoRadiSam system protein A [Pacificoceanicola onchidii]|uniref:AmmeMemoRadiSam system protein A n=1 Tax=Pacificoceanicola onchidii TaxID=2562685 RepID=UPI0010A6807E|nr:AmmeMemoRadiSam system protein A [Pacificoceanicola onchidii]
MAERVSRIAGRFCPPEQDALDRMLADLARPFAAMTRAVPAAPKAIVAPHGPYEHSGALAAAAWTAAAQSQPARIIVLSTAHHETFDGIGVPTGHDVVRVLDKRVRIDTRACQALIRSGLAHGEETAFEDEHGIDAQLPFARHFLPKVPVVPILIGRTDVRAVARAIDRLTRMQGETLFVLSTDLSHLHGQTRAQSLDTHCARLLETGQPEALSGLHACGYLALAGWLTSQTGAGTRALRLGLHSAYHGTSRAGQGIGYGAWALYPPGASIVDTAARKALLEVARQGLVSRCRRGIAPVIDSDSFAVQLRSHAASFVALKQHGMPRGCAGSMTAHAPLVQDVVKNAIKAGFDDPRFDPIKDVDLPGLSLSISVLSNPVHLPVSSEATLAEALQPGISGVILHDARQRALLLPSEWDRLDTPEAFVAALKRKAGFGARAWDETMQALVFQTEAFSETPAQVDVA